MDILHVGTIEQDFGRFRQIVRGKIKQHLKQYMSNGEMIGKKGKDFISIPVPQIDLPTFKFGRKGAQGVGQGEGEHVRHLRSFDHDDPAELPGPDRNLTTTEDNQTVELTGFTREIAISELTAVLREVTVVITYQAGSVTRTFTLTALISAFA